MLAHPMIFVDSNIPMYLVGADHPHKVDARHMVEAAVVAGERLVTSCEVLQEILHRYVAIDRRDAIQPAFDALLGVTDEVLIVERRHIERAKNIVLGSRRVSARDALHVAVMELAGISQIMSFDRSFDGIPGITRLGS
jgi:predicted nucleic acid-binding protein